MSGSVKRVLVRVILLTISSDTGFVASLVSLSLCFHCFCNLIVSEGRRIHIFTSNLTSALCLATHSSKLRLHLQYTISPLKAPPAAFKSSAISGGIIQLCLNHTSLQQHFTPNTNTISKELTSQSHSSPASKHRFLISRATFTSSHLSCSPSSPRTASVIQLEPGCGNRI